MTDIARPALPFTRCPDCGAVAWPGWRVTHRHRPPCPRANTDPTTWQRKDNR